MMGYGRRGGARWRIPRRAGPGLIVVAERPMHDLLSSSGVAWVVQERQPSVAAMWAALSGGRLDQHSRILVFSDSLADAPGRRRARRRPPAPSWPWRTRAPTCSSPRRDADPHRSPHRARRPGRGRPERRRRQDLRYHWLPVDRGGRAVLDVMRGVLAPEVAFPDEYPAAVDGALGARRTAAAEAGHPAGLARRPEPVVGRARSREPEPVASSRARRGAPGLRRRAPAAPPIGIARGRRRGPSDAAAHRRSPSRGACRQQRVPAVGVARAAAAAEARPARSPSR